MITFAQILETYAGKNLLEEVEYLIVREALIQTRGNVSAASRLIGIDRRAFERRLRAYFITETDVPRCTRGQRAIASLLSGTGQIRPYTHTGRAARS